VVVNTWIFRFDTISFLSGVQNEQRTAQNVAKNHILLKKTESDLWKNVALDIFYARS
jgi:hypothetical protein